MLVLAFVRFSWISAYIGLTLRDPETVQSIGLLWVIPLVFASSAFVPTSSMPTVLARHRRRQSGQPDRQRGRGPGYDR